MANQKQVIKFIFNKIENKCITKNIKIADALELAEIGYQRQRTICANPEKMKLGELIELTSVLNIDIFHINPNL